MTLTLLTYTFHDDIDDARAEARPAHLSHLEGAGAKLAGPALDRDGEPIGSVIILSGMTDEGIQKFIEADPYVRAGVVKGHTATPFIGAVGPWKEET